MLRTMNETMTTAANVVAELQARGLETRPLSGREFPVPCSVASDPAYRWRLLSIGACRRILRAAFPRENINMIDHWAGNENLDAFTGALGVQIRAAVSAAICTDILRDAVIGRRLQHSLAGVPAKPVRALRPLDVVRPSGRKPARSAERQEEIDALELVNMGRMYA
jgi:hypothetical protein